MHRTDGDANAAGMFTNGTPGTTQATEVEQDWLNAMQEEVVNVVLTMAGIALVKADNTQLGAALTKLFIKTGAQPSYGLPLVNGLLFESRSTEQGTHGGKTRLIIKAGGTASEFWLTVNALFTGASAWTKDRASGPSLAIMFSNESTTHSAGRISILQAPGSAGSPFTTGDWVPFTSDAGLLQGLVARQLAVAPALLHSWIDGGGGPAKSVGYYSNPFGECSFEGTINDNAGAGVSGSVMFNLPATHRPLKECYFICPAGGPGFATVTVKPNGDVLAAFSAPVGTIALDGVHFGF